MTKKITLLLILFYTCNILGQEILLRSNFSIRDFDIQNNTLVYIEKRDVKSFNLISNKPDTIYSKNKFFIGGFGLNIFFKKNSNKIITSSNELGNNRSSIRTYDLITKTVNKYYVYYTTTLLNTLLVPDEELLIISKKDSTIEIFKHKNFIIQKKQQTIKTDSYARKLNFFNNELYYITDSGRLVSYNFKNKSIKIIYKQEDILVNFAISKKTNEAFLTTYNGKLLKVNLSTQLVNEVKISDEIIEALEIIDDKTIAVGDWNGDVFIIESKDLNILEKINLKKRIIKIKLGENKNLYISSADKTIRKINLIKQ